MLLASFLEAHNILFENRVLTKEQVYKKLVDRLLCSQYKLPVSGSKLLELNFAQRGRSKLCLSNRYCYSSCSYGWL